MIDFYPNEEDPEIKAQKELDTPKIDFYPNRENLEIETQKQLDTHKEEIKKIENYSNEDGKKLYSHLKEANIERKIRQHRSDIKNNHKFNLKYKKHNLKDEINFGLEQYYNPNKQPKHSIEISWHHNGEKRKESKQRIEITNLSTLEEENKNNSIETKF